MGLLWGDEKKTCRECGMKIPHHANKCPYCRTKQTNNYYNDIEAFGCLGLPIVLIIILGILALIGTCL